MHPLIPAYSVLSQLALPSCSSTAAVLRKGSVVQTPEGLVFRIKPLFAWARAIALPALYSLLRLLHDCAETRQVTWLDARSAFFIAAIAIGVMQMPGHHHA